MITLCKEKFTILQQEILRLFFVKSGTTLNARRIARLLKVSAPAVAKALPHLAEKKFLKVTQDKESKRWAIELNRDNHTVMQLKRVDNLKQVYESGLSDVLEKEFAGATVILFGSYSRGEDTLNSDIDIAVVGRKEKNVDVTRFSRLLEREIRINFYDSFDKIHRNLKENLCNGIVLAGGVEL